MLTRFSTGIVKGVATVAGALAPENVMKNDDFHKDIIVTKGELSPPPPQYVLTTSDQDGISCALFPVSCGAGRR